MTLAYLVTVALKSLLSRAPKQAALVQKLPFCVTALPERAHSFLPKSLSAGRCIASVAAPTWSGHFQKRGICVTSPRIFHNLSFPSAFIGVQRPAKPFPRPTRGTRSHPPTRAASNTSLPACFKNRLFASPTDDRAAADRLNSAKLQDTPAQEPRKNPIVCVTRQSPLPLSRSKIHPFASSRDPYCALPSLNAHNLGSIRKIANRINQLPSAVTSPIENRPLCVIPLLLLSAVLAAAAPPPSQRTADFALVLDTPSASEQSATRNSVHSAQFRTKLAAIRTQQQLLRNELAKKRVCVTGSASTLVNAVFVRIPVSRAAEIRNLPGVSLVVRLGTVAPSLKPGA